MISNKGKYLIWVKAYKYCKWNLWWIIRNVQRLSIFPFVTMRAEPFPILPNQINLTWHIWRWPCFHAASSCSRSSTNYLVTSNHEDCEDSTKLRITTDSIHLRCIYSSQKDNKSALQRGFHIEDYSTILMTLYLQQIWKWDFVRYHQPFERSHWLRKCQNKSLVSTESRRWTFWTL